MSKYRITLEGKTYEIEVELLDGNEPTKAPVSNEQGQIANASSRPDIRVIDPSVRSETHISDSMVSAPMPGTVSALLAEPGSALSKGQTVIVLEAMKMENEIVAPKDGALGRLFVEQGQTVQGGDPLFEMA